jgi:hypothetical protein
VLGVALDFDALGQPRLSITMPVGRETSASTANRSGVTAHSSSSSRVSASTGSSPTSTLPPAPSAQRPAQVATHGARRPANQRPSASRATHRTDIEPAASSLSRSDQRIGCSVSRSASSPASNAYSRAASPSCAGEPRSSSAAIARSAAALCAGSGSNESSRHCTAT